jgi:hypothetical protein
MAVARWLFVAEAVLEGNDRWLLSTKGTSSHQGTKSLTEEVLAMPWCPPHKYSIYIMKSHTFLGNKGKIQKIIKHNWPLLSSLPVCVVCLWSWDLAYVVSFLSLWAWKRRGLKLEDFFSNTHHIIAPPEEVLAAPSLCSAPASQCKDLFTNLLLS